MPKIPQKNVKQIEDGEAEDGGGRKFFDGYVLATVIEVEEQEVKDSGYAGQNFKYQVESPKSVKGTWVWDSISYHPNATWRFRMLFDATGYEYDSDTDELVENSEQIVLNVAAEVQTRGKNAGSYRNQVTEILEANDENLALVGVTLINPNDSGGDS